MRFLLLSTFLFITTFEILFSVTFEKIQIHPNIDNAVVRMIRQGEDHIDFYLPSEVYRSDRLLDIYYSNTSEIMFGDDYKINNAAYVNSEIMIDSDNGLYFFDEDFNQKRKITQEKDTLWSQSFCGTVYNENKNHYVSRQCHGNLILIDENYNIKQSLFREFFIISAIYDLELIENKYYISCADSPGSLGSYSENIFITDEDFNILDTVDFNLGKKYKQTLGVHMFKLQDYIFYSSYRYDWKIIEDLNTNEFFELDSAKYSNMFFTDMIDANHKIIISARGGLFEFNKNNYEIEPVNIIDNIDNQEPTIFHDLEIIDGYCYASSDNGVYRAELSTFTNVEYEKSETTQLTNGRITNNDILFNIKVYSCIGEIIYSEDNVTDVNLKTKLKTSGIYFVAVESGNDLKLFKYLKSE